MHVWPEVSNYLDLIDFGSVEWVAWMSIRMGCALWIDIYLDPDLRTRGLTGFDGSRRCSYEGDDWMYLMRCI